MNEFMKQLERWHEEDEYQKIVDAIEALPREELTFPLVSEIGRASCRERV